MKQKLDEKGLKLGAPSVEAAGSNPAESNKLFGKEFNQKADSNFGDKPAGGSGCGYRLTNNLTSPKV